MNVIEIRPYQEKDKAQIIELILNIQVNEFNVPVTIKDQPDLENIPDFYQKNKGNFWVAVSDDEVVGTIALIDIGNKQSALRKVFVAKDFRGKSTGIAQRLLEEVIGWCRDKTIDEIYLGTLAVCLAAHRFYEKNEFLEVLKTDLPKQFPIMQVDTKFYVFRIE